MANTTLPKGFKPADDNIQPRAYDRRVAASETFVPGDIAYINSSGYLTATASTNPIAGVIAGSIIDGVSGLPVATSSSTAGRDRVKVWDPRLLFIGQVTVGAVTDEYTHYTATSMYDVAGSSGAQYIDAGATSLDQVQILGNANEPDGSISQLGAYQKVVFRFNTAKIAPIARDVIARQFV